MNPDDLNTGYTTESTNRMLHRDTNQVKVKAMVQKIISVFFCMLFFLPVKVAGQGTPPQAGGINRTQTFQEFLATQSVQMPLWGFVINLILAAMLAFILSKIYARYGTSISNRTLFADNFMLVAMTTMLIISIVKSSLALSLGLVGALSIVRFRAAIKEPEELAYLFLTIAIGLGLGADQRIITTVAFILIVGIVILRHFTKHKHDSSNLNLVISNSVPNHTSRNVEVGQIVEVLKAHCRSVSLRRLDEANGNFEASFLVEFLSFDQLNKARYSLRELDDSLKFSLLENRGIF